MNNDTASKALEFINSALASGRTVYLSTMLRVIEINPKTAAKFAAANRELFKLTASGLRVANGNRYELIATSSMMLVGLKAA